MPRLNAFVRFAAVSVLVLLAGFACRSGGVLPWPPPPVGVGEPWSAARANFRAGTPIELESARRNLARALELAPRWTPALRAVDDLARSEGDLGGALQRRLDELAADPEDVVALYLVGRLEGEEGVERFERAVELDPAYPWGHHGAAWAHYRNRDGRRALSSQRRALELATSSAERATFANAFARYALARGESSAARATLGDVLAGPLLEFDRIDVALALARVELVDEDESIARRGARRALELLETADLDGPQLSEVVRGLRLHAALHRNDAVSPARLESAATALRSPARTLLLAELTSPGDAFGAALIESLEKEVGMSELIQARLVRGEAREAMESWLAEQPQATRDERGDPTLPTLAELVRSSREQPLDREKFGRNLLDAGWFDEAYAWSSALSAHDLPAAEALRAAASRERALLQEFRTLFARIDEGRPHPGPWGDGGHEARLVESLEDLLDASSGLLAEAGDEAGDPRLSPIEKHGPFASVALPGPTFTRRDDERGAGTAGDPVPGLAAAMARRGRFAVFGTAVGTGGPDGAILRLLALEEREGEHLGVPFTGLCAWCEGQDVPSRPERRGAVIGGAALHEGWWIDVAPGRASHARWERLAERLRGPGGERIRATLEERGPRLQAGHRVTDMIGTGGLGDRLRLVVLEEREVTLDDVLQVTARHEEGHLCDRTRFLPILKHLGAIVGLLWQAGGRPQRVAELLEYRAQLTALCVCEDPRLPLARCLDRLENPSSATPHDAGYAKLVEALLKQLEQAREEDANAYPQIDAEHYLVHQLHLLSADELRVLARRVADAEGLIEAR